MKNTKGNSRLTVTVSMHQNKIDEFNSVYANQPQKITKGDFLGSILVDYLAQVAAGLPCKPKPERHAKAVKAVRDVQEAHLDARTRLLNAQAAEIEARLKASK